MQSLPSPPSREQQLIHEITHMPFAPWCPHCVAMRSMPDRSEGLVEGPRDVPCISYDFCYTGYDPESNEFVAKEPKSEEDLHGLLCCLVAHDSSTGSVLAVPCESKASTRHLGVELMRFIQSLGHATVQIKCDSEPATLSLQKAIVTSRQCLGLKTLEQNPPIHHHQSNGAVEKAVDLIRRLAMTMVQCVREKAGVEITVQHPVFAWSFVHAAWVRNRFAVRGGLTSYERCKDFQGRFRSLPQKAPGPDGWNIPVLKALPLQACNWIAEVCRRVEATGVAPAQWTVSLVVLLAKKPQIERPIALCHVVYKIWIKSRYYLVEQWLDMSTSQPFTKPSVTKGWNHPPYSRDFQ